MDHLDGFISSRRQNLSGNLSVRRRNLSGEVNRAEVVYESDYDLLDNKPQIEGVTLEGNKTYDELNLKYLTNEEIEILIN